MGKGISTLLGVLGRRGFPAVTVFASVIGASFAYLAVTPRLYETSARLMLDDKKASVSELGRDLTQINSTAIGRNPLADQAELLKSQTVLQLAISKLNPPIKDSSTQKPLTASDIRSNLKVIIVPATNILDLRYQSPKDRKSVV